MSILYINCTSQKPHKMTLLLQNNFGQTNSAYLPAHSEPRQLYWMVIIHAMPKVAQSTSNFGREQSSVDWGLKTTIGEKLNVKLAF